MWMSVGSAEEQDAVSPARTNTSQVQQARATEAYHAQSTSHAQNTSHASDSIECAVGKAASISGPVDIQDGSMG